MESFMRFWLYQGLWRSGPQLTNSVWRKSWSGSLAKDANVLAEGAGPSIVELPLLVMPPALRSLCRKAGLLVPSVWKAAARNAA